MEFDNAYFDSELEKRGLNTNRPYESYNPIRITDPDPTAYPIVSVTTSRSGNTITKFNPNATITYLRDCGIVFDMDGVCRKFDGRIYAYFDEREVERMIYVAVDSQPGGYVATPHDITVVVSACKALLPPRYGLFGHFDGAEEYETEKIPLIAFENGIYNPETGKMLPFTSWVYLTSYIHARFDPLVKTSPAKSVLKNILPQQETLDALYEMIGYFLFEPTMYPPALFNLYGPGNTGKSAIANMIAEIIGWENVAELGLEQLTDKFTTAELEGKKINICGETDDTPSRQTKVIGATIKKLSDGQRITVQKKYGHPYQMRNTAKLLFCTNSPPDFGDDSSGIYRRLYIIPCRQRQDPKAMIYDDLVTTESKSYIVNRSLDAYLMFVNNGKQFSVSQQMNEEHTQFESQNGWRDFIQNMFGCTDPEEVGQAIANHEDYCYTTELYSAYLEYIRSTLGQPMSRKRFVEKIRNEYNLKTKTVYFTVNIDGVAKGTTRTRYVL